MGIKFFEALKAY